MSEVKRWRYKTGFSRPGHATMAIQHILRRQSASCLRVRDGFTWDCTLCQSVHKSSL